MKKHIFPYISVTLILMGIILFSGCIGTQQTKYVCPDGSSVLDPSDCPKSTTTSTRSCPPSCDDGDECTIDYCSSATNYECRHESKTNAQLEIVAGYASAKSSSGSCDILNNRCDREYIIDISESTGYYWGFGYYIENTGCVDLTNVKVSVSCIHNKKIILSKEGDEYNGIKIKYMLFNCDPLTPCKDPFVLPDKPGYTYGHVLSRLPKKYGKILYITATLAPYTDSFSMDCTAIATSDQAQSEPYTFRIRFVP